jgi:hypothetical protein
VGVAGTVERVTKIRAEAAHVRPVGKSRTVGAAYLYGPEIVEYDAFEEGRIKHLEMIQAVIGRLGTDSFLVKGWAVTVVGAFLGFAVRAEDPELALASLFPTLLFWGLDAYFLRSERLFRALYDHVRNGPEGVPPFFMSATSNDFVSSLAERRAASWWNTVWRPTLLIFYGALATSGALVILSLCLG